MTQRIYLDNNASAPLDPRIADFIIQSLPILQGNPSSSHHFGQRIRSLLSKARANVAAYLKVKANELVFTSGGTECVNMAIFGLITNKKPGHIITSLTEHACVIACCKQLETQGYEVTYLPTGAFGTVLPEDVRAAIRPDTLLIALMAVNNETGVMMDIESIAKIAKENQIPFFVDAIALLGKENIHIPLGVSVMAFSGHKIHALQGIGLLFLRSGVKLKSMIIGGEQEYNRRAGTENVLGILSFAKAIELLNENDSTYVRDLRDEFERRLFQAIPGLAVNGEGPRVSNVSNLAFPSIDGEALLMGLDRAGIAASHGSACSSGSLEPSRVLLAMGLPLEKVNGSIRFSFSRLNTLEEIEASCMIIIELIKRLKR